MNSVTRQATAFAAAFGATGVLLGAFGAHYLKDRLAELGTTPLWQTAVLYQLVHSVALLAAAGWRDGAGQKLRFLHAMAWCWALGLLLFSGSLYLLALHGPRWLGPATPLGGAALIAGWGFAVASARTKPSP